MAAPAASEVVRLGWPLFLAGDDGWAAFLSWLPVNGVVRSPSILRVSAEAGPEGWRVSEPGRSWRRMPADTMTSGATRMAVPVAAKPRG